MGGVTLQVLTQLSQLSKGIAQAHAKVKYVMWRAEREAGEYCSLKNITQTQASTNT